MLATAILALARPANASGPRPHCHLYIVYSRRVASRARRDGASMGQRFHNSTHDTLGRRWASSRFWRHLAALCVAAALSIAALTFSTSAAPHARAAGGDAIVHWD